MEENPEILIEEAHEEKISKALNWFWLGFIIYVASYTINQTHQVNYTVFILLQILGLVLLIPSAVFLIRLKFDNEYLKVTYILYCCWLFGVVIRGISFDYHSVNQMLFDAQAGLFLYLAPLILLFPRNLLYLKKVFNVILILCAVFIVYDLIFLNQLLHPSENASRTIQILERFTKHLSIPAGFLLLTFRYHSKRRILVALAVIVITLLFAAIVARRGLLFKSLSIVLFTYFMFLYKNRARLIIIINSLIIVCVLMFIAVKLYNQNNNDAFSLINERIFEDTRTGVEFYFFNDMQIKDWIIGKGINGTYYCPGIGEEDYRSVIETGFLQVILNGGLISLGLLLFIAIPAIFKGLFYSKNILSKAAATWILLSLLFMYPSVITVFSLQYLLVWISIGICYSKEIRNLPEDRIKEILLSD